jgi:hypothetical protein
MSQFLFTIEYRKVLYLMIESFLDKKARTYALRDSQLSTAPTVFCILSSKRGILYPPCLSIVKPYGNRVYVYWIHEAQDMIQRRTLVKTVMKLRIQLWTNANFSGRSYPLRNWIWRGFREKLHGENVSVRTIRSAERLHCYIIKREHYSRRKRENEWNRKTCSATL